MFYGFYEDADASESQNSIEAYSPISRQNYAVACATDAAENVTCVAADGGEVHFDLGAVALYDDDQAATYASTHDLGPERSAERGKADYDSGTDSYGAGDPYEDAESDADRDYGDTEGYGDSEPPIGERIPNYDNGNGYPVQCADGMWSKSGGIQGACSGHGGVG